MKTACQIANTKYSTKVHYTVLLNHALTLVICYINVHFKFRTLLKFKVVSVNICMSWLTKMNKQHGNKCISNVS